MIIRDYLELPRLLRTTTGKNIGFCFLNRFLFLGLLNFFAVFSNHITFTRW